MASSELQSLGWKPSFDHQFPCSERDATTPARVGAHFGSQVLLMFERGEVMLPTQHAQRCGELAVGDWVLVDLDAAHVARRLPRESLIVRKAAGDKADSQLIAANVDTLFIVSSCNHDFSPARLERYLATATEASVKPVLVLTKPDLCEHPETFNQKATQLMNGLHVVTINARDPLQTGALAQWCGIGMTVAMVGSSGVGKSTLAMALGAGSIRTQEIREDDSKGRHTTTTRSIHRLDTGGLLIDTPGMRELQLVACEDGVAEVFDEIVTLAQQCRFRDCSHANEPGCAVLSAIEHGELDARRLKNYRKLQSEQARNAQSLRERRDQSRKMGQYYKSVMTSKRRQRDFSG